MKDGFDWLIAQGGANVSGGQKQRLSIARALVGQPEIFVFDDSFSSLDYKTDAKLRTALKKETAEAGMFGPGGRPGGFGGGGPMGAMGAPAQKPKEFLKKLSNDWWNISSPTK